jgi:glutamyl-tRNA synthetase
MTTRVRFAPSPTGYLHVGNARTALITWLFARKNDGYFLLRIDDTDTERSSSQYQKAIEDSLQWLGIDWDEKTHQRDRFARYNELIEQLKQEGWLYPCYETQDELALKRKTRLSRGLPPIYDRAALSLTDEDIKAYEAEGRTPHWRFKLKHEPITWDDCVRGEVKFEGADLSDPVLIREDGRPLYHLCSVIDDMDYGMTHVVRGEDHVANTAAHVQMFEALGATPPAFAHLPLLSDPEGGKLSKRLGGMTITGLRDEEGLEAMAINSLLARTGTSDPIEAFADMRPLIESFDFAKFSRGSPKLDTDELMRLNARVLQHTSYQAVQERLKAMGLGELDEDFWYAVRANLGRLDDIKTWWHVAKGPVEPVIEEPDYIATARALLPDGPWDDNTWKNWTDALKAETGRKGKQLFMPLRKALTGMDHGPDMASLLPLIGYDTALARLDTDTGKVVQNAQ